MGLGHPGKRVLLNAAVGLAVVVTVVTMIWPTWIESLTGEDPDGGDGSFERWFARLIALVVLAVVVAVAGVWRRRAVATRSAEGRGRHG